MLRHVWNEQYAALYDRTYRVLYDAGINEKLADKLANQRTLAATLSSRVLAFTRCIHCGTGPHRPSGRSPLRSFVKEPFYEQSLRKYGETHD
jgi:hypothetical protein